MDPLEIKKQEDIHTEIGIGRGFLFLFFWLGVSKGDLNIRKRWLRARYFLLFHFFLGVYLE